MESIRVKYEDGVFKPLEKLRELKEGAIGEVYVNEGEVKQTPQAAFHEVVSVLRPLEEPKGHWRRIVIRANPPEQIAILDGRLSNRHRRAHRHLAREC